MRNEASKVWTRSRTKQATRREDRACLRRSRRGFRQSDSPFNPGRGEHLAIDHLKAYAQSTHTPLTRTPLTSTAQAGPPAPSWWWWPNRAGSCSGQKQGETLPPSLPRQRTQRMNHKEHALGELELRPLHAKEALQCLLHSILFLRAPNVVRPREVGFCFGGTGRNEGREGTR